MADHSRVLKSIEKLTDPKKLKTLIERAREHKAREVEEAAFRKLISLVPEEEPGTVAHDFWQTIHAFEFVLSEENGKTTLLSRTRQKLKRVGVMATLCDLAMGKQERGFHMLIERGMPELTGEAIVLRHTEEFPSLVVETARARLKAVGYHPTDDPNTPGSD